MYTRGRLIYGLERIQVYICWLSAYLSDGYAVPGLMVTILLSKGTDNVDGAGTYYLRLCQYLVRDSISDSARDQWSGWRRGLWGVIPISQQRICLDGLRADARSIRTSRR